MRDRSEINRQNAQLSTGPRTAAGKWIASHNALRHGMFARHLLLPGEDAAELRQLKCDTIRRFNPRDGFELRLVERVVITLWKLNRLQRLEQAHHTNELIGFAYPSVQLRENCGLGKDEAVPLEQVRLRSNADRAMLERIEAHEYRLENTLNRTLRQLMKLQQTPLSEDLSEFAEAALAQEQPTTQTAADRVAIEAPAAPVREPSDQNVRNEARSELAITPMETSTESAAPNPRNEAGSSIALPVSAGPVASNLQNVRNEAWGEILHRAAEPITSHEGAAAVEASPGGGGLASRRAA